MPREAAVADLCLWRVVRKSEQLFSDFNFHSQHHGLLKNRDSRWGEKYVHFQH